MPTAELKQVLGWILLLLFFQALVQLPVTAVPYRSNQEYAVDTEGNLFLGNDETAEVQMNREGWDGRSAGDAIHSFSFMVQVLLALVAVIALIYLIRYLLRRNNGVSSGKIVKVLEATSLAVDKSVFIVEIMDRIYIVAGTQSNLVLLDTVKDRESFQAIKLALDQKPVGPFGNYFRELLDNMDSEESDDRNFE